MKNLFTSECVRKGHPDKICDLLSDAILDAYLEEDKDSRVAVEVMAYKEGIFIFISCIAKHNTLITGT